MTFAEINKRFTAKALEFMAEGYYINTSGLTYLTCGYSHEFCHLELTNGKDIILIVLADKPVSLSDVRSVVLEVYEAKKDVLDRCYCRPNMMRGASHIGTDKSSLIYAEEFFELDYSHFQRNWFGTREEAESALKVHFSRTKNRRWVEADCGVHEKTLPQAAHKIALKYIRRYYYSSYKLSDITAVKKSVSYYHDTPKVTYYAEAKGKTFVIR